MNMNTDIRTNACKHIYLQYEYMGITKKNMGMNRDNNNIQTAPVRILAKLWRVRGHYSGMHLQLGLFPPMPMAASGRGVSGFVQLRRERSSKISNSSYHNMDT